MRHAQTSGGAQASIAPVRTFGANQSTWWIPGTFIRNAVMGIEKSGRFFGIATAIMTILLNADALGQMPNDGTSYRHGDTLTLQGSFGTQNVRKTFLGGHEGMIESQPVDGIMPDGNGWTFSGLAHTAIIKPDPTRGKVLFNTEDNANYAAYRRYDHGDPIPEQRYFYKAHYVRNVLLLDGAPYSMSYQWKHERINWEPKITDGDCEIKVHNWFKSNGGMAFVNRSSDDKSTYYIGRNVPDHNGDWALLEIMVFTGTKGQNDGKVITRVHKNGQTAIGLNKQTERVYNDPSLRLRYFLEQNYFGNFAQSEAGPDNNLPKPQIRELYSDDSRVIVGLDATSGWKRIELRDTIDLRTATIRELQDWTSWNGNIDVKLNTGGIGPGEHDLYLVVIDGVDADGWDIVNYSKPIRIRVDPGNHPPELSAGGDRTIPAGNTISFTVEATDGNNDALSFSASGAP